MTPQAAMALQEGDLIIDSVSLRQYVVGTIDGKSLWFKSMARPGQVCIRCFDAGSRAQGKGNVKMRYSASVELFNPYDGLEVGPDYD